MFEEHQFRWGGVMVEEDGFVAIFNSIHRVMQAEKILKEHRLPLLLIPVPRALQSDCGLALCFPEEAWPGIHGLLAAAGLLPEYLYRRSGEDFCPVVVAISGKDGCGCLG
jgi:hypothetical protein